MRGTQQAHVDCVFILAISNLLLNFSYMLRLTRDIAGRHLLTYRCCILFYLSLIFGGSRRSLRGSFNTHTGSMCVSVCVCVVHLDERTIIDV